ncbi:hypothetical protein H5410_032160 [Solanum commersonii]|uniref:PB1-like domain-containing protein n=1 Tax=Solanum commersonii TaxID=4109 RepID=A0A9J5YPI6_SOLCO|nr:hypothetical protein H5410_032160 [Solanum commersonii]
MDVYVTLRFHHGEKLQQKSRIKYEGGIVTDCFDVDVDKLSYFEFVDIVKEIGYNCSACVVYIKPPKCQHIVEVKSDRLKKLLSLPPEIGYLNDMGGKSNATFDKESSQTFEGSEGLGFEEVAQPEEPIVGEDLGEVLVRTSASAGEDLGRASAGVGEDLGKTYVSVGEDLGGTFSAIAASDIPEVGSDWESEIEASDDLDNADLSDKGEKEYGSDVHEEGKIAGDEPYFDSDKAVSFEIDIDEDVNEEDKGLDKAIQDLLPNTKQRICAKSTYEQELTRNLDHMDKASAIERGRGTATGNGTGIGVDVNGSGATGRGRETRTGLVERGRETGLAGREEELQLLWLQFSECSCK